MEDRGTDLTKYQVERGAAGHPSTLVGQNAATDWTKYQVDKAAGWSHGLGQVLGRQDCRLESLVGPSTR